MSKIYIHRFVVLVIVVHLLVRSFDGEAAPLPSPGSKKIMAATANWNHNGQVTPRFRVGSVRDDACTG